MGPELPPLFKAIAAGDLEQVKTQLRGGADPNQHHPDGLQTPLQDATRTGNLELVTMLIDFGADADLVIEKKNYDAITNYSPIELAAMTGKIDLLKALLAKSKLTPEQIEHMLFMTSIAAGDLAAVKKHLAAHPDSLEKIDQVSGHTPLVAATLRGRFDIVKHLLSKGANVNAPAGKKGDYQSPLIAAVCSAKLPLVELMVKAGADLEYAAKETPEWTALKYAKDSGMAAAAMYLQKQLKLQGKTTAKTVFVGVTTFDTNDALVLVEAPIESVTSAFAEQLPKPRVRSNVHGKKVKLTPRCYGVFKISNQPWTTIIRLNCQEYKHWPSAADAQAISAKLKCRAYIFANSDTAGATQYVLFDAGRAVEYFEHGADSKPSTDAQLIERAKRVYNIDLSALKKFQHHGGSTFASQVRSADLRKVKNDIAFIEEYVAEMKLYVPFNIEPLGESGERAELVLEEIGAEDLEGMDFVVGG